MRLIEAVRFSSVSGIVNLQTAYLIAPGGAMTQYAGEFLNVERFAAGKSSQIAQIADGGGEFTSGSWLGQ
jgi:hypothetical protein